MKESRQKHQRGRRRGLTPPAGSPRPKRMKTEEPKHPITPGSALMMNPSSTRGFAQSQSWNPDTVWETGQMGADWSLLGHRWNRLCSDCELTSFWILHQTKQSIYHCTFFYLFWTSTDNQEVNIYTPIEAFRCALSVFNKTNNLSCNRLNHTASHKTQDFFS